jgi:hypothetical protein
LYLSRGWLGTGSFEKGAALPLSVTVQISLLIPSDGHPNVVRYFARVDSGEFIYLVLERCECSLAQAIARCAIERRKAYRRLVRETVPVLVGSRVARPSCVYVT